MSLSSRLILCRTLLPKLSDEVIPLSAHLRGRLRLLITAGCLTCLHDFSEWGSRQRKTFWRTRSQSHRKAWDITSRLSGSRGSILTVSFSHESERVKFSPSHSALSESYHDCKIHTSEERKPDLALHNRQLT